MRSSENYYQLYLVITYYNVTKNVIIIMDYKSFKHLHFALIINYSFDKSTIIIVIKSIISFTECGIIFAEILQILQDFCKMCAILFLMPCLNVTPSNFFLLPAKQRGGRG